MRKKILDKKHYMNMKNLLLSSIIVVLILTSCTQRTNTQTPLSEDCESSKLSEQFQCDTNPKEQLEDVSCMEATQDTIVLEKGTIPPCILDSTNGITYFIADNGKRYPLDKYFRDRIEVVNWEKWTTDEALEWSGISSYVSLQVMNDSLLQHITSSVNHRVSALLNKEKQLTDSLWAAKHNVLRGQLYGGGDHVLWSHIGLSLEQDSIRMYNLQEFYTTISTGEYSPIQEYRAIPKEQFAKAYSDLNKNIHKMDFYYHGDIEVDSVSARRFLQKEKLIWDELLTVRNKISKLLSGNRKKAFDNGTRRLEWYQLIQLKNEYADYGLISNEVFYCCLQADDPYEFVIKYPNFTTVYNRYFRNRYGRDRYGQSSESSE